MKLRSLMTAICVLATANIVSAAPFAYVANSGTKTVSIIDTADNMIKYTVALPDTKSPLHPYAYGIAVGASGQKVYVGLKDTNEIYIFDAVTRNQVKRIGLGTDSPGGLAVNAAESRLYVTSNMSNTLIVIDITGSGAVEVGRVSVDDASVSSPDGVVLNSAGDKAYVASTTTGNVAEISLNETNNVYSRLSVIPLGSQPVGLALSTDGSKLYASDINGTVKLINTASKAITNLTVGAGTVTVAIKPDGSKVYAPSTTLDKLYVIDGVANTVLGDYAVADGPFGSAVTPDGAKLYLTGKFGAGNKVQVFDTTTNGVSSIVLPDGSNPTSMGDFIGPVFDYTITSAAGTNCTISPLGAIPVNDKGRSFNIAASVDQCQVFVGCDPANVNVPKAGEVDKGFPVSYAFTNVSANDAICARPVTGTFYTLTASWISSVGGSLVSTPAGINASSKSAQFLGGAGKTVTVKAANGFSATSWTGDCAGTPDGGTCTFSNLAANKAFGATVILGGGTGPVFNVTKSSYYQTLSEAMAAAATNDVIKVSTDFTAGCNYAGASSATMVTLSGNWKAADYNTKDTPKSMGALTITTVGVTADDLTI